MEKYFNITAEKHNIRCKIYYQDLDQIKHMILFGHGFGGHKNNKAAERFANRVMEKNKQVAMICFDWPCHGEDVRKTLTLDECDTYLRLVLEYIQNRFAPEILDAYGNSFGGYLFLKYISEHGNPFHKIALRSPAIVMYYVLTKSIMTEEDLAKLGKGKPVPVGFDRKVDITASYLEEIKEADLTTRDFMPYADQILILHGTEDEIVPFEAVKAFAEDQLTDFIPFVGADHRFQNPKHMDEANAAILSYFDLK